MSSANAATRRSTDLWRPLRTPIFRQLLIADVVSDAIESPTWRAVLPELVRKEDLPAASALNGIEFNMARAIGPALAGGLIAAAGVGAAFLVSVASFVGVIVVVARWKRPIRTRTTPTETFEGATIAAVRYVRNAPVMRAVMLRTGVVMFCASASFALLPTIAHRVSPSAIGYGILLGCFGAGAIGGAVVMQRARARWSIEVVVSVAVGILGAMTAAIAGVHTLPGLMVIMIVSGGAWIKANWYVVASNDRMIDPEQEKSMAKQISAKTTTLPSSHVAMLSHPNEVARVIEQACAGRAESR